MPQETLVKVDNVSKKFCQDLKKSLWYGVKDVVSEVTGQGKAQDELRPGEFWSVADVSFELKRGECLGLIGPNGAGKSTLLKMLNGLIKPDKGRISIRGRVGALIELGAGFNPILTGRENIYVNGAVLGLSRQEIERKFESIVEFSEIGDFLDTPVQNYSSGMKVRLGFAVASHMEPDVLIIDEVLAVGDVGFRSKCYNAIYEINKTAAVIFVSHNMQQMSRLCSKALVMNNGELVTCEGNVPKAIASYLQLFRKEEKNVIELGENKIFDVALSHELVGDHYVVNVYEDLGLTFKARIEEDHQLLEANITILTQSNDLVAQFNSRYQGYVVRNTGDDMSFAATIPGLNLNPGFYFLSISIVNYETNDILSWHHAAIRLKVKGDFYGGAMVQYQGEWQVD